MTVNDITPEDIPILNAIFKYRYVYNNEVYEEMVALIKEYEIDPYEDLICDLCSFIRPSKPIDGYRQILEFEEPTAQRFYDAGMFTTDFFKDLPQFKAQQKSEAEMEVLQLQKEALQYQQTIRDKEEELRELNIEVGKLQSDHLRNYILYSVGGMVVGGVIVFLVTNALK